MQVIFAMHKLQEVTPPILYFFRSQYASDLKITSFGQFAIYNLCSISWHILGATLLFFCILFELPSLKDQH